MNFDYIKDTKCLINNKEEKIRLGKQSTGITELYLLAFELATEQLKQKEIK